jgi:hypothetical protein
MEHKKFVQGMITSDIIKRTKNLCSHPQCLQVWNINHGLTMLQLILKIWFTL